MPELISFIVKQMKINSVILVFILFTGLNISCSRKIVKPPEFDGGRAMSYLKRQVSFGPRVPGSEASKNCRNYFYNFFDSLQVSYDSNSFSFKDPYSNNNIPLVNILVTMPGKEATSKKIILVAHYDSRPRTDFTESAEKKNSPIEGANDGASGVAVLMELAVLLNKNKPDVAVELLFVDGEDWGKSGDSDYYLLGSKEFAKTINADNYYFGIVLDMIGDKDQQVYREEYSERFAREINDIVWEAAARLSVNTFHNSVKYAVQDDHLPLNIAGVRTIDLIDFDYPYWHTEFDTADKCSAESLENIGKVLLELIYNRASWLKKI